MSSLLYSYFSTLGTQAKQIAIVGGYIVIWSGQALLVRGSRTSADYSYSIMNSVLMIEFTKLVISLMLYFSRTTPENPTIGHLWLRYKEALKYMKNMAAAAFVYGVYNILMFVNLRSFDPGSYRVLINVRIVWSGILYTVVLHRPLSKQQWFALILLLMGCALNRFEDLSNGMLDMVALGFMTIQAACSALGSAWNEEALKKSKDVDINITNSFMYLCTCIFNLFIILTTEPSDLLPSNFFAGYSYITVIVVIMSAFGGFLTSLFLRHLNMIIKEFANGGEMFFTTVGGAMFFGAEVGLHTILAIVVVAYAAYRFKNADSLPETSEEDNKKNDEIEAPKLSDLELGEVPSIDSPKEAEGFGKKE